MKKSSAYSAGEPPRAPTYAEARELNRAMNAFLERRGQRVRWFPKTSRNTPRKKNA